MLLGNLLFFVQLFFVQLEELMLSFPWRHRCPGSKFHRKWIFKSFTNQLFRSNGQKGVLSSSGEFKFMFVTSLTKKIAYLKWIARP